MPVRYTYIPKEHIIYVECFGELKIQEITTYFKDIEYDNSIPLGAAETVDLSKISLFDVAYKEAAGMPANYTSAQQKKEIQATILFGASPTNTGLARLIEAYFRKYLPKHAFTIVESYEQALECLRDLQHSRQHTDAGTNE